MKKKNIILIIIGIILISSLLIVIISKKEKKYIMQDGAMLALTLDGTPITSFPEGTNYRVEVDCENATGTWLVEEWKLGLEDITGNATCNIDFTTRDDEDKLINVVETETTEYTSGNPNYTTSSILTQSEYGIPSIFYSSTPGASAGTTMRNSFVYSETQWSSVPTNLTSGSYFHFRFVIPEENYYQFCYTIHISNAKNSLGLYLNNLKVLSKAASSSSTITNCVELGKLTTNDIIKVVQYAYGVKVSSYTSTAISTINFYLQKLEKGSVTGNVSVGSRYTGKTPSNYVWFNNEMWRIIGSIPTCTSSGCATSENLVKIIRDESIGSLAYDAKSSGYTGLWGSNTLYSLLNTHYYATSESNLNGQSHSGCYGYMVTSVVNCNYSDKGILSTSYYGKMVKNVYWNTGPINDVLFNAAAAYLNEVERQTVSGYVGLVSLSDYGYATESGYHELSMDNPNFGLTTNSNWLYGVGTEFNSIYNIESQDKMICIEDAGNVGSCNAYFGSAVRPVVYLDPSVYVVSGDGSITYPYQITM